MAAPELAIKLPPASSGPGSSSQKHFTLQQVQCVGKTSLSEMFLPQLWVTSVCSGRGNLSRSTAVASVSVGGFG